MENNPVKNPPKWLEKIYQYGYTLITGSITVGLIISIIDFFVNPQPTPPPRYPVWLITIVIAVGGGVVMGIAELIHRTWRWLIERG